MILAGEFPTRAVEAGLLYREGVAARIVLPREQLRDGIAEARALGLSAPSLDEHSLAVLLELGVPRAAILQPDTWSTSTRDEVAAIGKLARAHRLGSLLLVTNGYHSARAARLFARCLPGLRVAVKTPRHDRYDHLHPWRRSWDVRFTVIELIISAHQLFVSCP